MSKRCGASRLRRVYIVLSTVGVGGAEKRFTDNWHALQARGLDIHLVMDRRTHVALLAQPGYLEKLTSNPRLHVLDFGGSGYRVFCRRIFEFFATQPDGAILHYPLAYVPGVQIRHAHRLVVSWVNSAMPPFSQGRWRLGVGAWMGFVAADHLDVLNPTNFAAIQRVPGMASKLSLTVGGTQIDSRLCQPRKKALDFVFLGRVEPEKQALRFVKLLPEVTAKLISVGFRDFRFVVCGDGQEADAIRESISLECFHSPNPVPVIFGYSTRPEEVLGHAAVYFSLQRTSNYPSKALAEAMACGAYPILTAVGETSMMIDGLPHCSFVPRDFTAQDIFDALAQYLAAPLSERAKWSEVISKFALLRFGNSLQPAYFADLYERLS